MLLVEEAKGFLEVFLATVESLVDVFGVTLVGESHFAAICLEMVEDGVGEVINAHLLDFGKGDIDFPIGTHLLDKGGESVANVDFLIGLVLVDLSPVGIINDDTISQVAGNRKSVV